MSFFSGLKSIASKIEAEIESLWKKAPNMDTIALGVLTFAGPILETVFTITGEPALGTEAATIIGNVQAKLIAAKQVLAAVGPTLSFGSILSGAASDLNDLLTLAAIKDPASIANVKLVITELENLAASVPTPSQSAAA
jgi:hypothetical protein